MDRKRQEYFDKMQEIERLTRLKEEEERNVGMAHRAAEMAEEAALKAQL
jgi:hypothetical protein